MTPVIGREGETHTHTPNQTREGETTGRENAKKESDIYCFNPVSENIYYIERCVCVCVLDFLHPRLNMCCTQRAESCSGFDIFSSSPFCLDLMLNFLIDAHFAWRIIQSFISLSWLLFTNLLPKLSLQITHFSSQPEHGPGLKFPSHTYTQQIQHTPKRNLPQLFVIYCCYIVSVSDS